MGFSMLISETLIWI